MAAKPALQEEATTHTFPIALPIWAGDNWTLIGDLCGAPIDKSSTIGGTVTFIIHRGFRSYVKLELHVTLSDQDGGHRKTECVTINLDRLVNVSIQSSARVGASDGASTSESLPRIEGNAVAHGLVSEFTFELNGHVWAPNLFVTGWRGTSEYLLEALRRKISSSTTFSFSHRVRHYPQYGRTIVQRLSSRSHGIPLQTSCLPGTYGSVK